MNPVFCGQCGRPLSERSDLPVEDRAPCTACNSVSRRVELHVEEQLEFHESLAYKAKRRGAKKPHLEVKQGADLTRDAGTWSERQMVIDRDNDRYSERVVADDGTVLVDKVEKLSNHWGRGSARPDRT